MRVSPEIRQIGYMVLTSMLLLAAFCALRGGMVAAGVLLLASLLPVAFLLLAAKSPAGGRNGLRPHLTRR